MVVVGAGPSVTLRSDALRRCRDEVRVVASLSALWPLAKEGFSADYCVALDPSPSLYNQFAGLEDSLKGTPLVYFSNCPFVGAGCMAWSSLCRLFRDGYGVRFT